jgi:hypothetical protein
MIDAPRCDACIIAQFISILLRLCDISIDIFAATIFDGSSPYRASARAE